MEPLPTTNRTTSPYFFVVGLIVLTIGLLFGITASIQYVVPGFLKDYLSFERVRPLHVSSVVFWIILSAVGGVFTYLREHTGQPVHSSALLRISLLLFVTTLLLAISSYLMGVFGGREYWEFPPSLAIFIIIGWVLLIYNFVRSIPSYRQQPVYVWMWLTGMVFFLFTFLESYLWVFPYFRNNVVNDMTIQWKSYGSMVGSWNMLIYGSSIYLMDKITGNKANSHSRLAFVLYYTGLFNLMFNWGHHIYTLPSHRFIQYISYAVSMTELFILGRIIYHWRSTLSAAQKYFFRGAYRFLMAADVWIFLNLTLAIFMSIPAINLFTHGTHVTVAHTMGTTIGINSMLLLAFITDSCLSNKNAPTTNSWLRAGFWISNGSLFIFWGALITAGVMKSRWQMSDVQLPFRTMMNMLRPYFILSLTAGIGIAVGLCMIVFAVFRYMSPAAQEKTSTEATA